EFGEYVEDAEVKFAEVEVEFPLPEAPAGETALSTELGPQIAAAPRAAVVEAWLAVEQELDVLAERAGLGAPERRWGTRALVRELDERGVIDPALASVIWD